MGMERKPEILEFIKSKSLMTLSSINSSDKPEAALIGFGETNEFQLICGTSNASRKYANITKNPKVAVVIGLGDGLTTVQYEGTARELEGAEIDTYTELYFAKYPVARRHKELGGERYFLIEPTWLRYTDISTKPWDVVELNFNSA